MAIKKLPFHEVIAQKLALPMGRLAPSEANEFMTLLDVLQKSEMPTAAARKIAEDNAGLPKLLADVGEYVLAEFAQESLDDLKSREDEKKEGSAAFD